MATAAGIGIRIRGRLHEDWTPLLSTHSSQQARLVSLMPGLRHLSDVLLTTM